MREALPRRKSPRLRDWDYSRPGMYFLTLCARDRQPLFSRVVGGGVLDAPQAALTDVGKVIEKHILGISGHAPCLTVQQYVIMPNHVHLLVQVGGGGPSGTPAPTGGRDQQANKRIPAFVSTLKRWVNKDAGGRFWQPGYYDHIVRDERDYLRISAYIDQNPAKWAEDRYYTEIED